MTTVAGMYQALLLIAGMTIADEMTQPTTYVPYVPTIPTYSSTVTINLN